MTIKIKYLFSKVRDVRLITDPRTKRSKGIAYIEFKDTDSVPLVCTFLNIIDQFVKTR
jgi:RNA recognition motif-containing protein